jgi:hypothetical protein
MTEITNSSASPLEKRKNRSRAVKWIAAILGVLVLMVIAAVAYTMMRMNSVPADLDTSTEILSDQGLYRVSYQSQPGSISINQIHTWILHVETADGQPVENAQIRVDGDMPRHGHGLPTVPQVTDYLGNGDYLVEGMKFHMPGWWIAEFDISAVGQSDHVTFNFILE